MGRQPRQCADHWGHELVEGKNRRCREAWEHGHGLALRDGQTQGFARLEGDAVYNDTGTGQAGNGAIAHITGAFGSSTGHHDNIAAIEPSFEQTSQLVLVVW